jgi:hypothetical protein
VILGGRSVRCALELLEVAVAQGGPDLGAVSPVVALLATLPGLATEMADPTP